MYNVSFQVWRPSQVVQSDGCYSLVGENRFTSVRPKSSLIQLTPIPEENVPFQRGDVLGFLIEATATSNGLVLDTDYSSETVWHASVNSITAGEPQCPFRVGTQSTRQLQMLNSGAPVISISLSKPSPCKYTLSQDNYLKSISCMYCLYDVYEFTLN